MPDSFLYQRLYPTLRLGIQVGTTYNRRAGTVHCRQGELDGACGLHAAATALTLLGCITSASSLPSRRTGVAAKLWKAAQLSYFEGVAEAELAHMLESLKASLEVTRADGSHRTTLEFTKAKLEEGGLVMVSWQSKDQKTNHWVLVVGAEGMQRKGVFVTTALLVIDPAQSKPLMCAYNGRLELASRPVRDSRSYIDYQTNDGGKLPVTFTGAVGIIG
jgi:hypothetical protein